jgi:cobalamin synthase
MPQPFGRTGVDAPPRWAEYASPVWGLFAGVLIATLDHAFGYAFQNPLLSSALTVVLLAWASRWVYPAAFARAFGGSFDAKQDDLNAYLGAAGLIALLLVKVFALNALWLTVRWPAIALMPLAGRWGMAFAMNVSPCAAEGETGPVLMHKRSAGPVVWATLLFAGAGLLYVYGASMGSPLWDIGMQLPVRVWAGAGLVVAASIARNGLRLGGWTADRGCALSELVETATPLAVLLVIPG